MNDEQIREVWTQLNREELAKITEDGPPPVFATISGAHLYGFASADSDVDLRGAYLLPARDLLGLRLPKETLTIEDNGEIELDWVAHDLRKFARMMINHNGYVLEQLFSPLVVVETEVFKELRELGKGCVTRRTVRHYQGFFQGRRKRLMEPDPTVKHLLYAYRVLLTGTHLMRTGEVVSNVTLLNEIYQIPPIDEMVAMKREGAEKMALPRVEFDMHIHILDQLNRGLVAAHQESTLPEEPTTVDAINDLIVRVRLAEN